MVKCIRISVIDVEDTKGVIRIRKSKKAKKTDKETNNDIENNTIQTEDKQQIPH
jgi:hypothetical protein